MLSCEATCVGSTGATTPFKPRDHCGFDGFGKTPDDILSSGGYCWNFLITPSYLLVFVRSCALDCHEGVVLGPQATATATGSARIALTGALGTTKKMGITTINPKGTTMKLTSLSIAALTLALAGPSFAQTACMTGYTVGSDGDCEADPAPDTTTYTMVVDPDDASGTDMISVADPTTTPASPDPDAP